ncbi:MAG: hypothetical protein V3T24_01715 [Longimicrobiales bacterium]
MRALSFLMAGDVGIEGLIARIREASAGKIWWYRAPLSVFFAWLLLRHLRDPEYSGLFGGLNLAIHEGGHLFFMWFGVDFLTVAAGTLLQCACPVFAAIMFYRQRDYFAVTVAMVWLGTNFVGIAPYAADARSQLLPLVSPFPGASQHDWNYLLRQLGLLQLDAQVGRTFRDLGLLTMAGGIAAGGWVLKVMAESTGPKPALGPQSQNPS